MRSGPDLLSQYIGHEYDCEIGVDGVLDLIEKAQREAIAAVRNAVGWHLQDRGVEERDAAPILAVIDAVEVR